MGMAEMNTSANTKELVAQAKETNRLLASLVTELQRTNELLARTAGATAGSTG